MRPPPRAYWILMPVIWLSLVQPLGAQVLEIGNAAGAIGDVVALDITFRAAKAGVSALVGDIQFDPIAVSLEHCTINPAIGPGTASDKTLSISVTRSNLARFVVFGLGRTTIPSSRVFRCEFAVLPGALALSEFTQTSGGSNRARATDLTLETVSAADPDGAAVTLTLKPGKITIHPGRPRN